MQYSRVIRLKTLRLLPLATFFQNDPTLRKLAADNAMEPLDFIASEFVAEIENGEQYPDWVFRQVRAAMETRLMADDILDLDDGQLHIASRVMQAEFDEADRQWILDTFSSRADVQEVWKNAHARAWTKAA